MARFYGTVRGGRGAASRLGHASCGLFVSAQSDSGKVFVDLYVDEDDNDCANITACGLTIFNGPLKELASQSGRNVMLTALACETLVHG
jgi:hypothetical protein